MSDFKNIKKFLPGIQVWAKPHTDNQMVVLAEELEAILQSAQVVYGCPEGLFRTTGKPNEVDTHRALLLCVEPIKKKTKAEAALEYAERMAGLGSVRAKQILEMKDEV